jgi:hypothetical protein
MPHQPLHHPGRHPGLVRQRGALAPQRVEVEHPARVVPVGDAGPVQVRPEHGRTPAGREREHRAARGKTAEEPAEIVRQVVGQRERGRLAVLRVAR